MKKEVNSIFIILITFLIFISLLLLFLSFKTVNLTGQFVKTNEIQSEKCKEIQEPYEDTEYYNETIPFIEEKCETKQLLYKSSDDNLKVEVKCIEMHEECKNSFILIDNNIKCSEYQTVCDKYQETAKFDIINLDEEIGTWSFDWKVKCRNVCEEIPRILKSETINLDPTESKSSMAIITYNSKNQEQLFIEFNNKPVKEVCKDKINYDVITRTRQIIRYRLKEECFNLLS